MDTLDQLSKVVGSIVIVGGGLSVIVYQAFKYLAAKWLDTKFKERLQLLQHQHEDEIEQLRFKISAMLDRATKLHQREFEVLPEAWAKLNDSFWNIRSFVSPIQSYPDIDSMSIPQQNEFIASCLLKDWEKIQLREIEKKNTFYQEKIFWHDLHNAQTKARDAYTYLIKNGIFVDDDIRTKFSTLHDLIWEALTEHQFNEEHHIRPRHREKVQPFMATGENLMKELERVIHERLWPVESI